MWYEYTLCITNGDADKWRFSIKRLGQSCGCFRMKAHITLQKQDSSFNHRRCDDSCDFMSILRALFYGLTGNQQEKKWERKKTVLLSTKVIQMNRALNNSLWWAYPVRSPYFEASMPIHWRDKSKTLKIEPTQQAIVCSYNIRMRGKKIVCLATDSTRVVWINWLSW